MKILFTIINGDFAAGGGSNVALKNLMRYLFLKNDIQMHVVFAKGTEGSFSKWMEENGVTYDVIDGVKYYFIRPIHSLKDVIHYINDLWYILKNTHKAVRATRRIIRREKPDIVHVNSSVFYYGYKAARKEHVPILWHIREYVKEGLNKNFIPFRAVYLKYMKHGYTVSITSEISSYYDLKREEKDFVVFDGVMPMKETYYTPDKDKYFLYVGKLVPEKGVEELIKGYCLYAKDNKDIDLWLAGICQNYYQEYLQKLINSFDVSSDRVKFLGFRSDRYNLMQKAYALVVPSFAEAFGFITVEAIMNGCLVIGHNTTGTKFIMQMTNDCELPYMTVEEMADHMRMLSIQGPIVYKGRVLTAQKIAQENFSLERNGEEIYKIYKTINNTHR